MRKIYFILLALFLFSSVSMAENKAISKTARTSASVRTDSRLYVNPDILRPADGQLAPAYTIGAWINLGKYSEAYSSSNNMVVMGYGGRAHCNDNGLWNFCITQFGLPTVTGWGKFSGELSTEQVSTGEWHYVVAAYDNNTATLSFYLNGTHLADKVYQGTEGGHEWFTDESPAIYFGSYCFNGMIDEIHIWNKALSAEEVASAKNNAIDVDGLVGLYTFDANPETTGTFQNESTQECASTQSCYFENVETEANYAWANGLAYVSGTLADPTLVESDRLEDTSDIEGIDIDFANAPVEYYNLQGIRIAAENLVPGLYIVRQGNRTDKVLINE